MTITQKYILGLLSKYNKSLINKIVPIPDDLREALSVVPRYSKLCSYPDLKVTSKSYTSSSRSYRAVTLISSTGSEIPVTKSRVKLGTGTKKKTSQSDRQKAVTFFREAIQYQIDEFRANFKAVVSEYGQSHPELTICPLSGKKLYNGRTDCDHVVPFSWLLEKWLLNCTSFKKLDEVPLRDYYADSWAKFHKRHSMLRLTLSRHNQLRGSEGFRSKV